MLLLGTKNTATQSVAVGGLINLGEVYRKYCRKNSCGVKTFDFNTTGVSLQHSGIYHVTATITFSAPATGDVVFQITENGSPLPGALATETIATATTEFKTTVIDIYILVDSGFVLGTPSTLIKNIAIQNTGIASTVSNVVLNVEKVV